MRPPCGGRTPTPAAPDPATQASTTPGHCRAARGRKPQARVPARRRPHELVGPAVSIPHGPLLRRPDRRAAGNKGAAAAAPPASPRTPPQPPGPARPHRSPSPRADCPRPLDGRPRRAGASGALQGRLGPHSPLQHQDDGEPLGNLAESGAMQTLELRCGHSMATRRAARRTEAPRPGGGGGGGGGGTPKVLPGVAPRRALGRRRLRPEPLRQRKQKLPGAGFSRPPSPEARLRKTWCSAIRVLPPPLGWRLPSSQAGPSPPLGRPRLQARPRPRPLPRGGVPALAGW